MNLQDANHEARRLLQGGQIERFSRGLPARAFDSWRSFRREAAAWCLHFS
jgi:hypothetical protein